MKTVFVASWALTIGRLTLCCIVLSLVSCVLIPIPPERDLVRQETGEVLRLGESTKDDVRGAMGRAETFCGNCRARIRSISFGGQSNRENRARALAALSRIEAGEDFAALASELSSVPLDYAGQWINRDSTLGPRLRGARVGEVRGPIKGDFRFHIFRVEELRYRDIRGPYELLDGRWWRYSANRTMWGAIIILAGPTDIGAFGPGFNERLFSALIRFDENGIAQEFARVDEVQPCDLTNLICYRGGRFIRLGDPGVDSMVKELQAPSGQCGLYIYSDSDADPVAMYLDDEWLGYLFGRAYYYQTLDAGLHSLLARRSYTSFRSGTIECTPDELVFVEIGGETYQPELGLVDVSRADGAVRSRHLAIVDSSFEPAEFARPAFQQVDPELLSTEFAYEIERRIRMFDNYHAQYEASFMAEALWQTYRVRLRSLLTDKDVAALYLEMRGEFQPSFQKLCSELLAEIETESVQSLHSTDSIGVQR